MSIEKERAIRGGFNLKKLAILLLPLLLSSCISGKLRDDDFKHFNCSFFAPFPIDPLFFVIFPNGYAGGKYQPIIGYSVGARLKADNNSSIGLRYSVDSYHDKVNLSNSSLELVWYLSNIFDYIVFLDLFEISLSAGYVDQTVKEYDLKFIQKGGFQFGLGVVIDKNIAFSPFIQIYYRCSRMRVIEKEDDIMWGGANRFSLSPFLLAIGFRLQF